jgi:molybdopterin molybdotransferase
MLSVDEATARIAAAFACLPAESVGIAEAGGRVLAENAVAQFDQPPVAISAMDGYAVRAADVATVPAQLSLIGTAPAGRPFAGTLGEGEAVRIFTGSVLPQGADSIVIQEDTDSAGDRITVKEAARPAQHVRARGLDFHDGDVLVPRSRVLTARDVALLAAGGYASVAVTRKPHVAIVATGDELSRPGARRAEGGVIASSTYALMTMVRNWGGIPRDLGIFPDRVEAFADLPRAAKGTDLIVTQGGASVGDHDLVKTALAPHGFALDFWKIAMRPGKPLIFGRLGDTPLLGLPGNPVSAMVCAILFLRPAIAAMLGTRYEPKLVRARLTHALPENGARQDYVRARLLQGSGDELLAEPFEIQDSAMQKVFAEAEGLIVREVGARAARPGSEVEVLLLDDC